MSSVDIGWLGLAASLVLVVVTLVLSRWLRLRLERDVLLASVRVLVQLLLVGLALLFVLDENQTIWWSWAWVVAIVGIAAATVTRRAREVPAIRWIAVGALGLAAVVTLGVVFPLGIFPLEPRYLVPTAGMMVGNAMQYTVLASRRVIEEFREQRDEIEARLALGQPGREAIRPYLRRAIQDALVPQIERTKAVGVVALPGAMTGLILAGVDPVEAVLVQAAIMYLILGAVATTAVTVSLGLASRLVTADHRLVRLPRRRA